ncbi:alpha/beta fold hydrolase [Arthrobacter sp. ES3-54]|jgi:alpha-beta hydrolase superfamily lysophospholipase|uniref:alpha/beta hydrolase n=1 Tax=Arthrobacter sp. ES3-54 TaxID=1502991 RepID=UPI00240569F6|nr:alpha/beta fold hydrolase [Arthrobacter sp. ES3-54]
MRKLDDREPGAGRSGPAAKAVLRIAEAAGETRAVALILHGGRADSYDAVSGRHLSPARMRPFARALHRQGGRHGLAVWTLRNRYRGWNGEDMSPVHDARWALAQISQEHPGVPVYLLGHSMGGLTALCVADDAQVEAVVALAPWINHKTPVEPVAGRRVLIVHGAEDHWTSPANSLAYARRAEGVAESVDYVSLKSAGHFMLTRVGLWNSLANGFILDTFGEATGADVSGSTDALRSVLRGALPAAGTRLPVVL